MTGPETLFQIEVPVELVLLSKAPAAARPALARALATMVTGLAAATAEGTRFSVHLCLGDMNNRAFGALGGDVTPLVLLANAVIAGWPEGRPLEVLHAPFAAADQPASTDAAFYAPLAQLRLPAPTIFAAGFAHESQALADQTRIRSIIEERIGREARSPPPAGSAGEARLPDGQCWSATPSSARDPCVAGARGGGLPMAG